MPSDNQNATLEQAVNFSLWLRDTRQFSKKSAGDNARIFMRIFKTS
jgi:hypothetical protein